MFPLGILGKKRTPPTGLYLFNGTNGATTDTNSSTNPIGNIIFLTVQLFQQQKHTKAQVQ